MSNALNITLAEAVKLLPSGEVTRIAERVGVSKQFASKALAGEANSAKAERVRNEALEVGGRAFREKQVAQFRSSIEALSDEDVWNWLTWYDAPVNALLNKRYKTPNDFHSTDFKLKHMSQELDEIRRLAQLPSVAPYGQLGMRFTTVLEAFIKAKSKGNE